MRLIDADALKAEVWVRPIALKDFQKSIVLTLINEAPSIDIVRCQDCKHWVCNFNGCARNPCTEPWYATDFCNYGEREGE